MDFFVILPDQHVDKEGKCFPCSYCGRKFGRRQGLLQHERIHTGERPFNCPTCNKSFRQRSALVVHIKTHTGDRSFLCFVCSKSFYTPGDLKKHVEIHTTALYASRGLGVPVSSELTCDSSKYVWNGHPEKLTIQTLFHSIFLVFLMIKNVILQIFCRFDFQKLQRRG